MNPSKNHLSNKLIEVISNPVFPELDTQLRAGRHICSEDLEKHAFVHEYFEELDKFYRRYSVELIRAPEDFYYLRTKSTSILPSSQLSELEMLCGKILCLLYLSPERLAQQGIFTVQEVYDELISLIEVERLVKLINPRSTGSDLDKAKLQEKLRAALNRLARMGIISFLVKDKDSNNKFLIRSSCFRFGAEVRSGEDVTEAQEKLIRMGEIVTPESLAERERALKALAKDDTTAAQASASLSNAQVGAEAAQDSTPAGASGETTGDALLEAAPVTAAAFAPQQGTNAGDATDVSDTTDDAYAEAEEADADHEVAGIEELFEDAAETDVDADVDADAADVDDDAEQESPASKPAKSSSGYQWAEDDDWEDDDDWDEFDDLDDDDFDDEDEDDEDEDEAPARGRSSGRKSPALDADAEEVEDDADADEDENEDEDDSAEYAELFASLRDSEDEFYEVDLDAFDLSEEEDDDEEDDEDFIIDVNQLADLERFDYDADDDDADERD